MKTRQHTDQCGLSLIELLLAISVMAILATGSVQGWQSYRQRAALEQASAELLAFMSRLQQAAHWRNETLLLRIGKERDRDCLIASRPQGAADCFSARGPIYRLPMEGMRLELQQSELGLGFYGVRNTAGAGHIVVQGKAGRVRIVLSATGRLRRCAEGDNGLSGLPRC